MKASIGSENPAYSDASILVIRAVSRFANPSGKSQRTCDCGSSKRSLHVQRSILRRIWSLASSATHKVCSEGVVEKQVVAATMFVSAKSMAHANIVRLSGR